MKAQFGSEAAAHDRTIPELIDEHVHSRPHAEALCSSDGDSMSYKALDTASRTLADHLTHELDVGPEVIVPLCFEKSIWTVVAIVAVLRAGAAFVLLDPAHPTSRLDTIIRKCRSQVGIASPTHQKRLSQLIPHAVCLDRPALRRLEERQQARATASSSPPQPHNAAYAIFTSGSTGVPKAALIEHGSFVAGALGHAAAMRLTAASRVVQFASYNFDASITEMLTTLVVGGAVCVVPEAARLDPLEFARAVEGMRCDWAILTASFIGALEEGGLGSLRVLVQGGEAMTRGVLERWVERGVTFLNAYGQVEASVVATCTPPISRHSDGKSIGHAVAGRCWVVDPDNPNVLTAAGEVGELLVEGPHVGRGYLHDPEKTAAVFISRPTWHTRLFPAECDARALRFYRTGDLVAQQPDGSFAYVSRKDDMVKLNGQRVECGEIEHQFMRAMQPRRDVVVELVKRKVGNGATRGVLVGFVALDADWTDGDDAANQRRLDAEMRNAEAQVRAVLPKFMIPASFIAVHRIPISINGKVDRKGLRALGEARLSRKQNPAPVPTPSRAEEQVVVPTLSRAEDQLRKVWSRVLNVPEADISRTSAFQSLGGDSISAMQVVSQAAACGLPVTVQRILQKKTIAEITSGMVDAPLARTAESFPVDEDEGDEGEPFKLSPIQQLFFHLSPKGDNQDNISFLLRLNRNVSRNSIDTALEAVVSRNPMLRARFFEMRRGCWFQYISDEVLESYQFCSHVVNSTASSDLMPIIKDAQRGLDIKYGPLLRADLLTTRGGKEQLLFVCAHHLVTDFVSWRVIMQQVEEHMTSGSISPTKAVSFQTWCKLQERHVRSLPPQKLPFELPDPDYDFWGMQSLPNFYGDAVTEVLVMDESLSSVILGTASKSSLEIETVDVLLAATMFAFHTVFPERSIPAFFVEGHGREPSWDETIDLSSTVGWFTTILPMVVSQQNCKDPVSIVREIKRLRAEFPDKGLAQFAARYYSKRRQRQQQQTPMEITFNYAGKYQQLERTDCLFTEEPSRTLMHLDGFGAALPRFGLIEVLGNVERGRLKLSFTLNKRMRHRERVAQWMHECRNVLAAVAPLLGELPEKQGPCFPLLKASPAESARLMDEVLPAMGVEAQEVEDAYPCSPMQNGMLLSRAGDRGSYTSQLFLEVQSTNATAIDIARLELAWQAVIDRHAVLRTVFVESVRGDGSFDQVVLRHAQATTAHIAKDDLSTHPVQPWPANQPEHRLLIAAPKPSSSPAVIQLRLDISHVLIDGSSTSILTRDLRRGYASATSLARHPRPSYRSYISHITTPSPTGTPPAASLQYWTSHLASAQPCHLPSWSSDSSTSPSTPPTLSIAPVPPIPFAPTTSFCRTHSVTLSDLLKTAWALVLRAYTASASAAADPVFGYLSSGRGDVPSADDALGVFTNIQACRARVGERGQKNVLEVLRAVQEDGWEQMAHRECGLADVLHAMGGGGAAEEGGLFGTAMSLQRVVKGGEGEGEDGVRVRVVREMDPTEYAATFLGYVSDTDVELVIEYWTSKISHAQAENLAATVAKVIQSMIEHPHSPVDELDVISDNDWASMRKWNEKLECSAPVNSCIHHLIQKLSTQQPNRPAVQGWDASLSYGELEQLSSQLAGHLHNLGVGPECIVPVCMEKSAWTIVSMLSILKAGGAFVPFDPEAPLDRLLQLLKDTSATIAIASTQTAPRMHGHVQQVIVSPSFIKGLPNRTFHETVSPENLAYVLFTSGTTGVPKGIMMQHSQFLASSTRYSPVLDLSPESRVLQFSAYTFDASIFELWSTLTSGGCVCQISDSQRMNDVAGGINALSPDTMFMTPTMLEILTPTAIPSIRTIITGGEVIKQTIFRTWAPPAGVSHLIEAYGPTETAVYATFQTHVQPTSDRFSIGSSFCCRCWVVDPASASSPRPRLVPVGAAGELWLEGPSLARGYLNADAKTAAAFVERPAFAPSSLDAAPQTPLRRFYRTGDLVRLKPCGQLRFVGRNDSQVKVRGQRVELSEVEQQAALALPEAGVPVAAEALDSKLVLLVEMVGADEARVARVVDALETRLPSRLPRFMVPSMIVPVVDEPFPRMSSGKLNRKRLRALAVELGSRQRAVAAARSEVNGGPETPVERTLRRMLASVLPGVSADEIRMSDNFFHLGGDSFLAMKLVAAARTEGLRLSVASVLRNPTLGELAKTMQLETPQGDGAAQVSRPFEMMGSLASSIRAEAVKTCGLRSEDDIEDIYPATPLQEAFVVESTKTPTAYMAYHVVKLPADVNLDRFCAAWETCVQENTILRTTIFQTVQTKPPRPIQVVLRRKEVEWEQSHDLQAFLDQNRNACAVAASRVAIISDRPSRTHSFVWLAHHTLYDGYTMTLLLQRMQSIYHQHTPGPAPVPFRKYIEHLHTIQSSPATAAFWRTYLSNIPPTTTTPLPPPARPNTSTTFTLRLPPASPINVTLATTLRTAWALLLIATSQPLSPSQTSSPPTTYDTLFTSIVSGRLSSQETAASLSRIAGPTIAAVPVRVRCAPHEKAHAVLARVQDDAAEMAGGGYEGVGMRGVCEALGKREGGEVRRRLVGGSMFVVQQQQERQQGEEGWGVVSRAVDVGASYGGAVTVVCEPEVERGVVRVEVVYDEEGVVEVERMMKGFEEVVRVLLVGGGEVVVRDVVAAAAAAVVSAGKVDGLTPARAHGALAGGEAAAELRSTSDTDMERRLQAMWAESLGLDGPEDVGMQDDFIELGGDSLTAMQVSGVARREGFSLRVVDIMSMPVLRDMAACMTAEEKEEEKDVAPFSLMPDASSKHVQLAAADCKVEVDDVEDMYPCTPLQEGLMTASGKQTGSYVAQIVVELKRGTDVGRFKAAWESVVATHHILRTRIVHLGAEGMFQTVLKPSKPAINWRTASSVEEYVKRDRSLPTVFGGELVRYGLVTDKNNTTTFIWTAHHACYDGASVALLSSAVSAAYSGTPLPAPPPFSRFMQYLARLSPTDSDAFWRATLAGAPLPTPFPLPLTLDYTPRASSTITRLITLPSLRSSSRSSGGITTATLLQTAWALVLGRYAPSGRAVTLGVAQSGRLTPVADVERIPGPTLTTAPLRIEVGVLETQDDNNNTVAALLHRVQALAAAAIPHCHRGLQAIRRVGRDAAAACEFATLLTLGPAEKKKNGEEEEDGMVCDLVRAAGREVDGEDGGAFHTYPLLLECLFDDESGEVRVGATHDERVLERGVVERMVGQFENVVRQLLVVADDEAVADVELLTSEELDGLKKSAVGWVVDLRRRDWLAPVGVVGELVVEEEEKGRVAVQPAWLEKLGFARSKQVYATGKLARLGCDGVVEVVGSVDEMVELPDGRSFMARDVERLVSQVMWDREVAVQVAESAGEASLTAFVALGHGYVDDEVAQRLLDALVSSARDRLGRALPSFMVPSVFRPVRTLPRMADGRVDRLQLRGMGTDISPTDQKNDSREAENTGPSDMEQQLLDLWKAVLGLDNIGVHDSFLRLGGDSLDAMKLVAAARRQGILLTVKEIFENPVLVDMARLAGKVEAIGASDDAIKPFALMSGNTKDLIEEVAEACQIGANTVEDVYPCAPLQEGLMALSNVERGAYVAECIIPVPDAVGATAAWKALVAMTPVLRSRIIHTDEHGFVQVVIREEAEISTGENLDDYLREARQVPMSSGNRLVRAGIVIQGASQHLVLFAHHAVFDGWSWRLLLQRLYSLYQERPVPPSPPYSKFIQYLHQGLHPEAAEEYWAIYLDGAERTAFPPMPSSVVPQPDSHETRHITVGRSSENTSTSMIQTAWALLISRYTDSKDVVIGVTLSGRTAPVDGIHDMVGPTFATIPLRFVLDGSKTVSELAKSAQDVSINPVQHLGLQRIRQVSPSAHAACTFNSLLVVQPASTDEDDSSDNFFMRENDAQLISSFTNYGLVLLCQMLPDGNIDASLVFDSRINTKQQACRLLGQFEHLLQQISGGTAHSVHDVDFISPDDFREISAFNREPQTNSNTDLCMHELVERHARAQPDAPAVSSWDGDLTYAELDTLATRLAIHLTTSMGVRPGSTVPLCFEKCKWTQVAMLGVLKAGAAFLLLDPSHPAARLTSICAKVGATTAIVSSPALSALLTPHAVPASLILDTTTFLPPITTTTATLLPTRIPPTSTAYIVTTSGTTTGAPKACAIPHSAIVASCLSFAPRAHLSPSTRALQFASYSFDASVIETLMVWAAGGCTCVVSERERRDDLARGVARRKANWALLTPSLAGILTPQAVPSLRTVVLGGEAATEEVVRTWGGGDSEGGVTLLQAYGPCECTPVACCSLGPMREGCDPRDVGAMLGGVRGWVVDPRTQERLCPVGCVGELVIEGPTVGMGYVGDEEKMAEAFVEEPRWRKRFGGGSVRRFYKTGDLVRYAEDGSGSLVFVGRKDAQIKVRGQRIELSEIEHHLRRCMAPTPCDVAVELVAPEGASAYLAAFVALGDAYGEEEKDPFGDTKTKLGDVLPSFMMPRVFLPLRQLPLSAAGKIDRKSLRQMALSQEKVTADIRTGKPPKTGMEQMLQALWARVLDIQVDAIHTDVSFIELGGDSLSAMKLTSKARQAGLTLSVADIMRRPRFADMAEKCKPSVETEPTSEYKPFSAFPGDDAEVRSFLRETLDVDRKEIEDVVEATSVQKAMTEAAMAPQQGTINHVWLHFDGSIDTKRVRDACFQVVTRHGILRTVFVPYKQQLMQVVFRSHEPEWEEHDAAANDDMEDATAAVISASQARPERYGQHGLRFYFLTHRRLHSSRLIIRMPHSLYDGFSLPLILDDLRAAYEQQPGSTLPAIPPASSFSAHLSAWRHRQSTCGAETFWRNELKGSRITPIIAAETTTSPPCTVNGHLTRHIALPPPATPTKHTFETLFHTAWALVLRHLPGNTYTSDDVVFARAIANRALPLSSSTPTDAAFTVCGPTLNTVPVRVDFSHSADADANALLSAVEDARLKALPYECLETERLVRRCTDWADGEKGEEAAAMPRFGSLLLWNNIAAAKAFDDGELRAWASGGDGGDGGEKKTRCGLGWAVAPWDAADVQVTATPTPGAGVRIDVLFAEERVRSAVAAEMVEMLCRNIEGLWGGEAAALLVRKDGCESPVGGSRGDMSPDQPPTPESYDIVSRDGWSDI
ncbi:nonribosomal peptide protein [Diplodia corticola]|uniref:Nonribosomal peptide protein n=1 Tax=Diplodia corticola TaxID=236234 RepID=A0A1J9RW51_9PEZI|nr:nonribosomal peptide protein [Diplodia corticola]OJD32607.1 nonribosomal peptide protein [Diplodia corticola]